MREHGFSLTHFLPYKDRIVDSLFIRENMGQWKPVFVLILCSEGFRLSNPLLNLRISNNLQIKSLTPKPRYNFFSSQCFILIPLKTSKNLLFTDFFKGNQKGALWRKGSNLLINISLFFYVAIIWYSNHVCVKDISAR